MIRIIAQTDLEDNAPERPIPPANVPLADDDLPEEAAQAPAPFEPTEEPEKPAEPAAVGQPIQEAPVTPPAGEALMEPVGELPPQAKPSEEFEEIIDVPSELDKLNQRLSIQQKISLSLADQFPLRIIYTTLKGHTTERTVEPDYVHQAMTGNQILVAWDHLSFTTPFGTAPSRGDWRGFILNRIRGAKLEDKGEAVPA